MDTEINNLILTNPAEALNLCYKHNLIDLGLLLGSIKNSLYYSEIYGKLLATKKPQTIKVRMYCNWTTSKDLCDLWNKMSKGNYTWDNIELTWLDTPTPDFYCVINQPSEPISIPLDKTIVFQMEPNMVYNQEWQDPNPTAFLFVGTKKHTYTNNEWHLSKSYTQLSTDTIHKDESRGNIISTVLSSKYHDPGQIKRIDFAKYLDKQSDITLHVYGSNHFHYKNYMGVLPPYHKDDGLFPYKYTFNAENHETSNYYTEKLIDAILSECLCFYNGAPNISTLVDPRAYIQLELKSFEGDCQTIKDAIANDEWGKRIEYIRAAKKKILNETGFFPRIAKIINAKNN